MTWWVKCVCVCPIIQGLSWLVYIICFVLFVHVCHSCEQHCVDYQLKKSQQGNGYHTYIYTFFRYITPLKFKPSLMVKLLGLWIWNATGWLGRQTYQRQNQKNTKIKVQSKKNQLCWRLFPPFSQHIWFKTTASNEFVKVSPKGWPNLPSFTMRKVWASVSPNLAQWRM